MKQYLELCEKVIKEGNWQDNRTGIRTKMIPGAMIQFDNSTEFPIITTKKLAFKGCTGELLSFLRGYDNADDFERMGCKFWRANADFTKTWVDNPIRKGSGDLGRIYGKQWVDWKRSDEMGSLNQIDKLIGDIQNDPTSRRLKVMAWRPDELHLMALPPCHYSFNVIIEQTTKKLHLSWNQR